MPVPEGSLAAAGLGLGLPAADSRGHYQLLLSGRALADRYRRIYTAALSDRDQGGSSAGHPASRNKKILSKKKLKRKQKSQSKVKTRSKSENLENTVIIPGINYIAILLRLIFIAMYAIAFWNGRKKKHHWQLHLRTLCRVENQIVMRRRNPKSHQSSFQRSLRLDFVKFLN